MGELSTTKMSSKGQIVIPEEIRISMGFHTGDQFIAVAENDVVILKKLTQPSIKEFSGLISKVRKQAKKAYKQFQTDPYYPSLHFKQVHSTRPIFSVRITKDYRAVGIIHGADIIWFWIGSHSEYNNLLKQLRHG